MSNFPNYQKSQANPKAQKNTKELQVLKQFVPSILPFKNSIVLVQYEFIIQFREIHWRNLSLKTYHKI